MLFVYYSLFLVLFCETGLHCDTEIFFSHAISLPTYAVFLFLILMASSYSYTVNVIIILINLFIYLFIYGCVGSSFLCEGFL